MMQDYPSNPLTKPGYRLEWNDEFESSELDGTKWLPYYLPHWSSRKQSAPRYALRGKTLVLQIAEDQRPWCPEFDGAVKASCIQTGLFAGPIGSKVGQLHFHPDLVVREAQANVHLYTPLYGYFECRAKAVATSGNHVSLYMIGYEDLPERSGEICMFEIFGNEVGTSSSKIHYGIHPWADPTLTDEFYQDTLDIDLTAFHIYALEWTPTYIDFYLDNQPIRRINQSPPYPMQFMLAIYELPGGDSNADYPREFAVDYVRSYQPIHGY